MTHPHERPDLIAASLTGEDRRGAVSVWIGADALCDLEPELPALLDQDSFEGLSLYVPLDQLIEQYLDFFRLGPAGPLDLHEGGEAEILALADALERGSWRLRTAVTAARQAGAGD